MKIILSPAKSLDFSTKYVANSIPDFLADSQLLIKKLCKLSPTDIAVLMRISPKLGLLNYHRFQEWSLPFTPHNSKPAGHVFNGPAYQGLGLNSLDPWQQKRANKMLRILSGLYGILKPMDAIQPYRLEMSTRFTFNKHCHSLYEFWDQRLYQVLEQELTADKVPVLINLASAEYTKAAHLQKLKFEMITPLFKDKSKSGAFKIIMAYAKRARGLMARYIIENNIKNPKEIKHFDKEGYQLSAAESTRERPVFIRKQLPS